MNKNLITGLFFLALSILSIIATWYFFKASVKVDQCFFSVCKGELCYGVRMWNISSDDKPDCVLLKEKCFSYMEWLNCSWHENARECLCEVVK